MILINYDTVKLTSVRAQMAINYKLARYLGKPHPIDELYRKFQEIIVEITSYPKGLNTMYSVDGRAIIEYCPEIKMVAVCENNVWKVLEPFFPHSEELYNVAALSLVIDQSLGTDSILASRVLTSHFDI